MVSGVSGLKLGSYLANMEVIRLLSPRACIHQTAAIVRGIVTRFSAHQHPKLQ